MENNKTYTDEQIREMVSFISRYADDKILASADEYSREHYKEYVEALCAIDNIEGLRTKAYACYGKGNAVYSCDWKASEACLLKLVELANDYYAANTLGYIYYYGRTSNNVPDYDKAFKYFSVAALYGIYEAIYKIADMCLSGKGLPTKCVNGAENILDWLYYEEVKPKFLNGAIDGQLADVASRMGRIYLAKAKENNTNTDMAYCFFLEAEYALKLRSKFDFYGDTSVMSGIRKGMAEAREGISFKELDRKKLEKKAVMRLFSYLNATCHVSVKTMKDGKNAVMTLHFPKDYTPGNLGMLAMIPEIGFCKFCRKVKVDITGIKKLKLAHNNTKFTCDYCYEKKGIIYFGGYSSDGEVIYCRLQADSLKIRRKDNHQKGQAMHQIVGVVFKGSDKTYDYIYELDTPVSEGEQVVVAGYNGDTTVTVKKVELVSENDLALPLERYKKVISKTL